MQGDRSDSAVNGGEGPLHIGGLAIKPLSRELSRDGYSERVRPQDFKVLRILAKRRGELVTRQELVDACWDARIVGDDVINHSISMLRKLADRAGGFSIETVPRAGYRLVELDEPQHQRSRWQLITALISGFMALCAAVFWLPSTYQQGKPKLPSVALLPIGFDPSDPRTRRLAAATSDSLAHLLSDSGFTPILLEARPTSGEAPADLIIGGSIRAASEGAEANIRVEEARHGMTLFAKRVAATWKGSSSLPDRIAARIATNLNWTGALMILDRRHPQEPRIAAELLKQISMIVEGGDFLRAYEISRRIAPQAPRSAIAQLSLAFNTGFIIHELPLRQRENALQVGRAAANRAHELAPEFGDTYVPWCLLHSSVQRIDCEQRMRVGLRADPSAPFVASFLADFLHEVGRSEEALAFARQSLADDPYKPAKMARMLRLLEATGKLDEADRLYRRAYHYWPDYPGLEWSRTIGILERKDFAALATFKRTPIGPDLSRKGDEVAFAEVLAARDPAGIRRVCPLKPGLAGSAGHCMVALADIGDFNGAFAIAGSIYPDLRAGSKTEEDRLWLRRPLGAPESLLTGPSGAALRRDARFLLIAERIGLLPYWRSGRFPDFCRNKPEPVCGKIAPLVR